MSGTSYLLTILLLIPAVGAALVLLIPASRLALTRWIALLFATGAFVWSVLLFVWFEGSQTSMQFVERAPWFQVGGLNVHYHVGVDGISLLLAILTTFLMPISVLASWSISRSVKPYMACMLFLEVGMLGVFVSLDLVLFYVFWEVMLIPMYFLIGVWGGERRIYAAIKFFLYTAAASLIMLAGIVVLYYANGADSFDLVQITRRLAEGRITLSPATEFLLFLAFFVAFAVKVPLFPFHTWLPDAHVEAPTAGSVILAGVLLKMGTYGLLRFCLPLFPRAALALAPIISVLAIIGVIYGALVAMVQPDVKKLVAYSSVSHLGLVVLGIFAFNHISIQGATYQMLNHGVSTGGLFALVGMIYDRRHTRQISDFGGVAHIMPVYSALFMVILLSSIGLPGLNGFVGEFLILQGTFLSNTTYAAVAALTMILSAVYMLWMYQRVFLGGITREENRGLRDLNVRELAILLPLIIMALWMGVNSSTFLRKTDASVQNVIERVESAREQQIFRVDNRGN
jgi:NADH-quinone oxidoreductase subunit M